MDLSYGVEYEEFRQQVQNFLDEHSHHSPDSDDVRDPKVRAWQQLLIRNGYAARTIPKKYGGCGQEPDLLKTRIISEEFQNAKVKPALGNAGIMMLVPMLLEMGKEEQRQKFIRPTLEGNMLWCQGYSEPGAGSDLASLRTSAVLDGDYWVINGQKIWTTNAHLADWIFCLVRTEPDAPKHKGLTFLLFQMDTPGIDVRRLVDMTGGARFNEIFLTDVRVPQSQIVGERGQGWQVANAILNHERDALANTDALANRFKSLVSLMKSETLSGKPLIEDPVFCDRLMRIQGRVLALQYNDMRVLSAKVNKQDAGTARVISKLAGTELRHDLEALAIDALGELGLAYDGNPHAREDGKWQRQYMYSLGNIIGGGTSQIQKNIISERGLKMPREPKVT